MVSDSVSTSADWVTGSAVGAEDWGVAVEESEVLRGTGVLLLVGTVKNVVGLVGSVHNVTPEESGSNLESLA
jgi:hypothetical protein